MTTLIAAAAAAPPPAVYTASQIQGVLDAGLSFTLSDTVVQNITKLMEDMSLSTASVRAHVVVPKVCVKQEDVFVRRKEPVSSIPRPTGIEGVIATLRLTMNKVTAKTMPATQETVVQILADAVASPDPEYLPRIVRYLFESMSGNKINSRPLAEMMGALNARFPAMKTIIDDTVQNVLPGQYADIRYVDPDDDYDEYCVVNAQNLWRRARSLFLTNLVRTKVYPAAQVIHLTDALLGMIEARQTEAAQKCINNELIENIEILCIDDMLRAGAPVGGGGGGGGAGGGAGEDLRPRIIARVRALESIRAVPASQRPAGLSSKLMCSCINIIEHLSPSVLALSPAAAVPPGAAARSGR